MVDQGVCESGRAVLNVRRTGLSSHNVGHGRKKLIHKKQGSKCTHDVGEEDVGGVAELVFDGDEDGSGLDGVAVVRDAHHPAGTRQNHEREPDAAVRKTSRAVHRTITADTDRRTTADTR